MSGSAWWRGQRGEWYVVVQFVLFALIAAGQTTWHGWPARAFPDSCLTSVAAGVLLIGGASLAIAGARKHGSGLTALPYPAEGATLLDIAPYRMARTLVPFVH